MNTAPRSVADESVPRLPHGVRLVDSPAQGGMVLLAPERVFKPNPIAIEILKRCDGKSSVSAIADALATAYSAPRERVLSDVKTLLGSLADKQLLEL